MLELKNDELVFSFPEVHADAKLSIHFQRTLRIPDDGKTYPLPPGLGKFPVRHVDDYKANAPDEWLQRGGVMLPLYQSEALWLKFSPTHISGHSHAYPFAIKVSAGKRSAVTGGAWSEGLNLRDYLVAPEQPWLDGYVVKKDVIRQFVAVPLGAGASVEEQLTGKAEFGGIQIEVFPMKRECFDRRWPKRQPDARLGLRGFHDSDDIGEDCFKGGGAKGLRRSRMSVGAGAPLRAASMGLGAGGSMKQQIIEDPFGMDEWETTAKSRVFVNLSNSMLWRTITGQEPPATPVTADLYKRHNYPWYELYSDGAQSIGASEQLANIKSVSEVASYLIPDGTQDSGIKPIVIHNPNKVRDGSWT